MDIKDFFLTGLGTAIGTITGWWLNKAKSEAEIKGIELENSAKIIAMWQELSTKLEHKVDELSKKVEELTREIEELRAENHALKKEKKNNGV